MPLPPLCLIRVEFRAWSSVHHLIGKEIGQTLRNQRRHLSTISSPGYAHGSDIPIVYGRVSFEPGPSERPKLLSSSSALSFQELEKMQTQRQARKHARWKKQARENFEQAGQHAMLQVQEQKQEQATKG